jgi:hypothetical protein
MNAKTVGGMAAAMLALVGCTLSQQGTRKDAAVPRIGGGVEIVAPRRCVLRVMTAIREQDDAALGEVVWRVADEQAIDAEARLAWQANGLRVGVISGELPPEVKAILAAPPPKKVEALTLALPEGDHSLIDTGTVESPSLSLILGQKDKAVGKVYQDARGFVRVTATYTEGSTDSVSLRLAPEIHHGPMQHGWSVANGGTPMTPQQIIARDGQREETFRDLAGTLVLKPGQVAVLGGRHERRGSLGDFLFGGFEANSDRPTRKVIFIWAARSDSSESADGAPPSGLVPFDPDAGEAK